jgi:osmotically-inducible protein OsmY
MKNRLFVLAAASLLMGSLAATGSAFAEETVGEKIDDAALLAKIKTNLLRSPEVEGLDLNVDVKNGVVTLSGTAATIAERSSAERIAQTASGATKVENRIVLKPDSAADRPATPPPVVAPAPATVPPGPATAPPPPAL